MIVVGTKDIISLYNGSETSSSTVYVGNDLVWQESNGILFSIDPPNALLRQGEPITFDVQTTETAIFNWYDESDTLLHTGASYTPSASTLGTKQLKVTAEVDGEERNSINIEYIVQDSLPIVTDIEDRVSLVLEFIGEDIDIYHFLEYQPFNTIYFPRNTIVNGISPVVPEGYTITPEYHTVLMDTDKTITFTVNTL